MLIVDLNKGSACGLLCPMSLLLAPLNGRCLCNIQSLIAVAASQHIGSKPKKVSPLLCSTAVRAAKMRPRHGVQERLVGHPPDEERHLEVLLIRGLFAGAQPVSTQMVACRQTPGHASQPYRGSKEPAGRVQPTIRLNPSTQPLGLSPRIKEN